MQKQAWGGPSSTHNIISLLFHLFVSAALGMTIQLTVFQDIFSVVQYWRTMLAVTTSSHHSVNTHTQKTLSAVHLITVSSSTSFANVRSSNTHASNWSQERKNYPPAVSDLKKLSFGAEDESVTRCQEQRKKTKRNPFYASEHVCGDCDRLQASISSKSQTYTELCPRQIPSEIWPAIFFGLCVFQ